MFEGTLGVRDVRERAETADDVELTVGVELGQDRPLKVGVLVSFLP